MHTEFWMCDETLTCATRSAATLYVPFPWRPALVLAAWGVAVWHCAKQHYYAGDRHLRWWAVALHAPAAACAVYLLAGAWLRGAPLSAAATLLEGEAYHSALALALALSSVGGAAVDVLRCGTLRRCSAVVGAADLDLLLLLWLDARGAGAAPSAIPAAAEATLTVDLALRALRAADALVGRRPRVGGSPSLGGVLLPLLPLAPLVLTGLTARAAMVAALLPVPPPERAWLVLAHGAALAAAWETHAPLLLWRLRAAARQWLRRVLTRALAAALDRAPRLAGLLCAAHSALAAGAPRALLRALGLAGARTGAAAGRDACCRRKRVVPALRPLSAHADLSDSTAAAPVARRRRHVPALVRAYAASGPQDACCAAGERAEAGAEMRHSCEQREARV
jgi:hypothetical protein